MPLATLNARRSSIDIWPGFVDALAQLLMVIIFILLVFTAGQFEWHPEKAPTGPVSITLSTSDRQVYVYRDGVEIGRSAVSIGALDKDFGSHVYSALDKIDGTGRRDWMSTASFASAHPLDIKQMAERVTIPPEFLGYVRAIVSPGTTLIITNVRVSNQTQSGSGFNILTAD